MESALALWNRRGNEPWMAGVDPEAFCDRVREKQTALQPGSRVLNVASSQVEYLAGVIAAIARENPIELFLGSDRWTDRERRTALTVARPHIVWDGLNPNHRQRGDAKHRAARSLIMISSGGTTGGLRFAAHTWESLSVAAYGLQEWLGGGPINSVCFLPLHHVSGFMQVVRSFVTDGELSLADWTAIERGEFPAFARGPAVTSLVPTQLERLRHVSGAGAWLRHFHCVFLGGAGANAGLLSWARSERIRLAPGYGMTETAAQVATMRPDDFLAGDPITAEILPHAAVTVVDENSGEPVRTGVAGRLVASTSALFCGYYPDSTGPQSPFATGDRGVLDRAGRLAVLGRLDAIINTGGEKVDPIEIENAIVETGLVQTAVVFGIPHETWGEMVAAVVGDPASAGEAVLVQCLGDQLTSYKIPKRWLYFEVLPQNAAGKIDLSALRELANRRE